MSLLSVHWNWTEDQFNSHQPALPDSPSFAFVIFAAPLLNGHYYDQYFTRKDLTEKWSHLQGLDAWGSHRHLGSKKKNQVSFRHGLREKGCLVTISSLTLLMTLLQKYSGLSVMCSIASRSQGRVRQGHSSKSQTSSWLNMLRLFPACLTHFLLLSFFLPPSLPDEIHIPAFAEMNKCSIAGKGMHFWIQMSPDLTPGLAEQERWTLVSDPLKQWGSNFSPWSSSVSNLFH